MIKTRKQAQRMVAKAKKLPNHGKHGKRKTTLALEEALKRRADNIIDDLMVERSRAIAMMRKKIGKAKYHDLTDAVDKTTKNIQLLGGKDTGKVTFTWKD